MRRTAAVLLLLYGCALFGVLFPSCASAGSIENNMVSEDDKVKNFKDAESRLRWFRRGWEPKFLPGYYNGSRSFCNRYKASLGDLQIAIKMSGELKGAYADAHDQWRLQLAWFYETCASKEAVQDERPVSTVLLPVSGCQTSRVSHPRNLTVAYEIYKEIGSKGIREAQAHLLRVGDAIAGFYDDAFVSSGENSDLCLAKAWRQDARMDPSTIMQRQTKATFRRNKLLQDQQTPSSP